MENLDSSSSKKIDLITQILYKKYNNEFPWLSYKDLTLMVVKFCKDPIDLYSNDSIDVNTVKKYHSKVYPIIEKIQQVKLLRNFEDSENNNNDITPIQEEPLLDLDITPTLSYKTYTVFIDSKDRNVSYWQYPNPFQFPLGPSTISGVDLSNHSSINRSFSEIQAVSIKKIIIPNNSTITELPYLLLRINELGSNINGTNDVMNNCFGYLSEPTTTTSNHLYYSFNDSIDAITNYIQESQMTKIFSPRIELSKITINILNPEGNIIDMTEADDQVIIELQIVCLKKDLENNFILKPGS